MRKKKPVASGDVSSLLEATTRRDFLQATVGRAFSWASLVATLLGPVPAYADERFSRLFFTTCGSEMPRILTDIRYARFAPPEERQGAATLSIIPSLAEGPDVLIGHFSSLLICDDATWRWWMFNFSRESKAKSPPRTVSVSSRLTHPADHVCEAWLKTKAAARPFGAPVRLRLSA